MTTATGTIPAASTRNASSPCVDADRVHNDATTRSARRRVLIVAAAFPPTGGPGVQRAAKFAKYLPQNGWEPIVWSLDRMDDFPLDESLANDLPEDVTVIRTRPTWRGGLRVCAADHRGTKSAAASVQTNFASRLLRWRRERLFPDKYISWARASIGPLLELLTRERIDAVLTTFSPASNHWIGLQLKQRTGIPWIADFRDLWTDDYRYEPTSVRRHRADRALESAIVTKADRVIGVTPSQTALLAGRCPEDSRKFRTLPNGYDPDDFTPFQDDGCNRNEIDSSPSSERSYTVAYVGRLDVRRCPDALIAGLARATRDMANQGRSLTFRVAGHISAATRQRIDSAGIRLDFAGYVDHHQAIAEMHRADLLVACVPELKNADTTIPAKLFEYLASNRPILFVGPPDGEAARLIQRFDGGTAVATDAAAVAEAMSCLLVNEDNPSAARIRPRNLARFARRSQAATLAEFLNEIAAPKAVSVTRLVSLGNREVGP